MPHAVGVYLKGVGVEGVELDVNNHFLVHLDNGETVDAGEFKVDGTFDPTSSRPLSSKALNVLLSAVNGRINKLVGENATEAIDNLNEIIAFLQGFKDSETLASTLVEINNAIAEGLLNKVDKEDGKGLSTNDYTTEDKSRVGDSVTSIRVNGTTISRKDSAGLLDIGDVSNIYVADFTINDLGRLLHDGEIESLEVNGKALMQALRDHKAIGVLFDNDVPSISLASAYKDDFIYLSFVYMNELYRTSVAVPDNYDEVDESKSGIIYKEETTVYALDTYHEYFLDIDAGDVREAYLNNQEITCDYNSLRDAVEVDKYIRIAAETGGTVLVNAVFISDTIALTYIIENTLWQITIYRSEDENGNVYGRAYGNEIAKIDLSDTKNGSRYIITDFTLDTIIDGGRISVTSELIEAIKHNRPLAIYEEGGGRLYNIEAVEAYINNTTDINFEIPYNGGIRVEIRSGAIVVEGSFIDVVPTWHYMNDEVRLIQNANGDTLQPADGGKVDVSAGFFADKSLEVYKSDSPVTSIQINNQITILQVPLTKDGKFRFKSPAQGTAVEYTIGFNVDTQCSWDITDRWGSSLIGYVHVGTLSNIPVGIYLMKITLYTYVNTKGIEQTEYIAEIMQMTK